MGITLTLPSYSEEHSHADIIYELESRIDSKQGVPENQELVKGEFTPK